MPDPDGSRRDYVQDESSSHRPPYHGHDNNHDVPCDEHEYSHGGRWLDRKYCSTFVVGNSDGLGFREHHDEVRKSNAGTKWLVGIDNTMPAILAWQNAWLVGCCDDSCKEPRLLE